MFSLGVLAAAFGSVEAAAKHGHPLLGAPYINAMAGAWLDRIVAAWGGWTRAIPGELPPPGALMYYRSVPYRTKPSGAVIYDDHMEWKLDGGDDVHAGGGRTDNAITLEHSNVHWSAGCPPVHWLDPDHIPLLDAHVEADGDP
jgi:hypothetical protein